ncbi:hypothetical protein [Microvirga arsenatis]|uniref:Uncharacterized protein n=1 Tax=Microvirga arsenatis TaxID=2692265 RepID=A0ABW9YYC5_9HYPH|nr:hypothetical protein [Microvirga arsenatis]NBJ11134.1 hypothetical protein [Microvirga arsenatis]NBJ25407.1 hypothetical protein [Microvirga arsenatis]
MTVIMLPGLADGQRMTEGERQVRDVELQVTTEPRRSEAASSLLYPAFQAAWQSLPLLALESSPDGLHEGEVKAAALEAAMERERDRADLAQRQISELQEQLTGLRERQVLAAEQAENARFKAARLEEEVASLRVSAEKAQRTAEREKEKASSALEELRAANDGIIFQRQWAAAKEARQVETASLAIAEAKQELETLRASLREAQETADREKRNVASALERLAAVNARLATPADAIKMNSNADDQTLPRTSTRPALERRELPTATGSLGRPLSDPGRALPSGRTSDGVRVSPQKSRIKISVPIEKASPRASDQSSKPEVSATGSLSPVRKQRVASAPAREGKLERQASSQVPRISGNVGSRPSQRQRVITHDIFIIDSPSPLNLPRALLPDADLW